MGWWVALAVVAALGIGATVLVAAMFCAGSSVPHGLDDAAGPAGMPRERFR